MDEKTLLQLKEVFDKLPKPIQNAITSADVQKKLREAANAHKLHLDQWETMENEVLMALFGLKPIEKLQENIQKEIGVSAETAASLAGDISEVVFEPIREELERELEHPDAKAATVTGVEAARTQVLKEAAAGAASASPEVKSPEVAPPPPVAPATPPPPSPTEKAIRMPASGAYRPGEASIARKDVHDDPYRETPA